MFFDLDDFKNINDRYGHIAGDQVLKTVSQICLNNKRNEDIAARYGGEEIVLLLPETNKARALVLGERIREEVATTVIEYCNQQIRLTVSGGLAAFPFDSTEASNLLRDADTALYRAKALGKNQTCLYSQDKRRYVRVKFADKIHVGKLGINGSDMYPVLNKDISGGGLLFEGPEPHAVGSKLQVNFSLRPDIPLLLTGTVMRVAPGTNDNYDIGFAFDSTDNSTKNEIFGYVLSSLETPFTQADTKTSSVN